MGDTQQTTDTQQQQGAQQGAGAAQQAQQTQQTQIDYAELDSIVARRQQAAGNAASKAALEQLGLTGDELQQAVAAYKAHKQQAEADRKNAYASMEAENKQLKSQILAGKVDSEAARAAAELGIDAKRVPYAVKLADMSKATTDNGDVSAEAIKAALEQVVKDFPEIKASASNAGGFYVGANNSGGDNDAAAKAQQDRLYKLFGVKTK